MEKSKIIDTLETYQLVDGPAVVVAVHVGHVHSMQGTVEWGL